MKKAFAESSSELECSNCGNDIYTCDGCDDYFDDTEEIYCDEEFHYHPNCKPENDKTVGVKA